MPSLLSWNLNGLEEHRLDERIEAACLSLLLGEDPPDLVLFQEIVDRALAAHLRPHFGHAGYAAAIQPASGEYYVGAFVRAPLKLMGAELHGFARSPQGRALLELTVLDGTTPWRIQTAHLESGPRAGADRKDQLHYCLNRLVDWEGPAVFAGDTNLREAEARAVVDGLAVTDAWVAAGQPARARGTWTPPAGRGRARWFRFDRIYGNAQVGFDGLQTHQAHTESDPPVAASDHRGLRVSCRTSPASGPRL